MPRCLLIAGPPNSRKTSSLLTWTKAARPGRVHIVSCPREAGWETIPTDNPLVVPHIMTVPYELGKGSELINWKAVVDSIESKCVEIVTGKHGDVSTIAIDGLQRYGEAVLGWMSGGAIFTDAAFNGIVAYSRAKTYISEFMLKLMSTPINYVAFTCWVDYEKDKKTDEDSPKMGGPKAPRHIWPSLFGALAKDVVGMVSTVAAVVENNQYQWQTKAAGDIQGAGLEGAPETVTKIPLKVPQDYPTLERLLYPGGKA